MIFYDAYNTPGAKEFLWKLCLERRGESEVNISFKMPTPEEHAAFIEGRPFYQWLLVWDNRWIGYISHSFKNEIGIVLLKECRERGAGRHILRKFLAENEPLPAIPGERAGHFLANINPLNQRSIRLFQGAGFKLKQFTYALEPPRCGAA